MGLIKPVERDLDYVYIIRTDTTIFKLFQKPLGSKWIVTEIKQSTVTANRSTIGLSNVFVGDLATVEPKSNYTLENSIELVTSGAWEYAFNTADGWIGMSHGNDLRQFGEWLLDGSPTDILGTTSNTVFKAKKINRVEIGDLLNPLDDTDVVGTVWREHTITNENIIVEIKIEWLAEVTINFGYVAMCPYNRGANATSKGRYIDDDVIQDISTDTFTKRNKDTYGVLMRNDNNQLTSRLEILNPKEALLNYEYNGSEKTYISNSELYNKFYPSVVGSEDYITSIGEEWNIKFRFEAYMPE